MRRTFRSGLLLAAAFGLIAIAPVAAVERQAVSITAVTTFDEIVDTFTADGLPGCAAGTVENGPAHVQFTPAPGIFAGFKVFDCGSGNGFVLRLNARFGAGGSLGTWSVVDAWGSVAGMQGAGGLTGDPIEGGIIDNYEGSVVL
jgi:hypothetical protein